MEENIQLKQESKEYKYKVDKIEKYLSFAALIVFFLSFQNTLATYAFYIFAIIIFVYYFGWYRRKKLAYIKIIGDEITVHEGLFFRPCVISKSEFKGVKKLGSKIEVSMNSGRKVNIYELLLSAEDFKEVQDTLKNILKGNQ